MHTQLRLTRLYLIDASNAIGEMDSDDPRIDDLSLAIDAVLIKLDALTMPPPTREDE